MYHSNFIPAISILNIWNNPRPIEIDRTRKMVN